ncbi:hypothetical protein BDW02DRAFT_567394 [Decorospora gaudefroyi]|uniref:DUF7730 domain-containing protein n=1 Tax=Decorospora gaudefroyi TaxID=184978 RepID=A0A6A5KK47_9PLEO|nr:hypothetical protein BDW02DRAFT_567394 [Decorospora gaudefroyi]
MRAFILRKLRLKKPPVAVASSTSPSPDIQQLPRAALPRDIPLSQKQCALFEKLSIEIRLLIYEAVLTDPDRPLHFLHVTPTRGRPKKLGHWRCEEKDSPYLMWQHSCFGLWVEGSSQLTRNASYTNSDLLSLLLACRLIYEEAVQVLYSANYFSFRGIQGPTNFRALVAPSSWHMLRYVHISTTFMTPMKTWSENRGSFPRESYLDWEDGCRDLVSLTELRLLRIEMMIWDRFAYHGRCAGTVEEQALIFILSALKLVTARTFQVELNLEVPSSVLDALGDVSFELLRTEKLYDRKTFPT